MLRHASIYVTTAAVTSAIPFALLPFLTRWLGPADFGIVGSFAALVNVLSVVFGLNANGLIAVSFYRDGADASRAYVAAALAVIGGMVVIGSVILIAAAPAVAGSTGIPARWLWLVIVAAGAQYSMSVALSVAQTWRRPGAFAALQLTYSVGLVVITIALVWGAGEGWLGRAGAQAVGAALAGVAGLVWAQRLGAIEWTTSRVRDALRYGLPLLPHSLAAMVLVSVDRFALGHAAAPEEVGVYYLAFQLGSLFLILSTALNQAWQPWLYARLARDGDEDRREVRRALAGVFALLLGGSAVAALLSSLVVPVIGGARYAGSVVPLMLLAPAFALQGCYMFASGLLFYHQRTVTISAITVCVAALQAALSFSLARHGAVGVSACLLVSSTVYAAAALTAGVRAHPLSARAGLEDAEEPLADRLVGPVAE